MIDLVKHIETLLLENDCVIVPGLGGFIAHYHTATFNKEISIHALRSTMACWHNRTCRLIIPIFLMQPEK